MSFVLKIEVREKMSIKEAHHLIVKYLTRQATIDDMERLLTWLESPEHILIYNEFVKLNYAIDYTMNRYDAEKTKKEILQNIRNDKSILYRRKWQRGLKYAAVIILFFGLGYFYQTSRLNTGNSEELIPKEEAVTLEREDGMVEVINMQSNREVRDINGNIVGNQSGARLTYTGKDTEQKEEFNTLTVPYGKRFDLVLSDGTYIHLNAGTSIKYPITFLKEKPREVFLTGEAYFEVKKDKKRSFLVHADALEVEVLGTGFNVMSYPEDRVTGVVLVEGSVRLHAHDSDIDTTAVLIPGTMGQWFRDNSVIEVRQVNTSIYTAWRKGELVFRNMAFKNMIKKLERHYHIPFINENKALGEEIFNASFNNEPIENVLSYLSDSYQINYTIRNNTVYIK